MAPSGLQARIAAFEALKNGDPSHLKELSEHDEPLSAPVSTHTTPASTGGPLIDLKDWVIEDRPISSSYYSNSDSPSRVTPPKIQVGSPSSQAKRAVPIPTPPRLPPRKPSSPTTSSSSPSRRIPSTSVASSSSSPPSSSSRMLTLPDVEHAALPSGSRIGVRGHAPASSISSFHSVSLSSDGGSAAEPPSPHSSYIHTFPMEHTYSRDSKERDADQDSLAGSFEDVSTPSSYVGPVAPIALPSTIIKPSLAPKPKPRVPPPAPIPIPTPPPTIAQPLVASPAPRLPQRPASSASSINSVGAPSAYTRRVPPPPPPPVGGQALPYVARSSSRPPSTRTSIQSATTTATSGTSATTTQSDRSSILSRTTSLSSLSHRKSSSNLSTTINAVTPPPSISTLRTTRVAPIPPPARARYDALFDANVRIRLVDAPGGNDRPRRTNVGWRGFSVDLMSGDKAAGQSLANGSSESIKEPEPDVPPGAALHRSVVKRIWALSRLSRDGLRAIWDECVDSSDAQKEIDRNTFARGMWRIDEELRRARLSGYGVETGKASGNKVRRNAR